MLRGYSDGTVLYCVLMLQYYKGAMAIHRHTLCWYYNTTRVFWWYSAVLCVDAIRWYSVILCLDATILRGYSDGTALYCVLMLQSYKGVMVIQRHIVCWCYNTTGVLWRYSIISCVDSTILCGCSGGTAQYCVLMLSSGTVSYCVLMLQ